MTWVATGAMTTVLLAAFGVLSFWVAHALGALRDEMHAGFSHVASEIAQVRSDARSDINQLRNDVGRLETKVLGDYGERIARLEERING